MTQPDDQPLIWFEYSEEHEAAFRDFTCGDDGPWSGPLNAHLAEDALDHARGGLNTTLVFYENKPDGMGIGYVAMCCSAIPNQLSPEERLVEGTEFQYIPALLLGRIAVREGYQDSSYGTIMLDVVKNIALDLDIGCRFVVVDVQKKNKRAIRFYVRERFRRPKHYKPYKWMYDVLKSAAIEEPPPEMEGGSTTG